MSIRLVYLLSYLVLFSILGYDVFLLYRYAFDIPFWDTWDLMPRGHFSHLFEFYNENMQFFYFIISEVIYKTFNWNLRYFNFVNFGVYLVILCVYWSILVSAKPKNKINIFPLFLCPILTPMLGYNWLWVFLVQTHTFILFFLIAVYFGFVKSSTWLNIVCFALSLFCSVISMNIPLAIGGFLAYIIKECINSKSDGKVLCFKRCFVVCAILCVLFFLLSFVTTPMRFIEVKMSNKIIDYEYIKHLSFYIVNSLNMFSLAKVLSQEVCFIWFAAHFAILAVVFFEQYSNKKIQPLWAIMFGILFCVCGVVSFRGGEVYTYWMTYIRHNETAFMMLPATLMILFLSKYKFANIYGVVLLMLMLSGIVSDIKAQRFQFFGELFYKNGCSCLNHYWNLKTIQDWQCGMNFPIPHGTGMQIGQEKGLSFIDTIRTCM
ncbi:MAG: hypothetical protein IKW58_02735 [Alphaproteobacteria bacterium]|nr:hypothetical protein [Alphaproteobacteria bacterium]